MRASEKPIGVFDSGLGGLTVAKAIMEALPREEIAYFGDTARVPYGGKTREMICRFTSECVDYLIDRDVKMVLLACNTASASAVEDLRQRLSLPVLEVIQPGARAAAAATRNGRVGVIGTDRTVRSGAYEHSILNYVPHARVFSKACPLFVPLAEEGWLDDPITEAVAEKYLADLKDKDIDTLVLGCTHYPLLKKVIGRVMGDHVKLVDSAAESAIEVTRVLGGQGLLRESTEAPVHRYFVTDAPERFRAVGEMFLQKSLGTITQVNL